MQGKIELEVAPGDGAANVHLLGHLVRDAPDHGQGLADHDVARTARKDLIQARPEIDGDALGQRSARVGEDRESHVGRLFAVTDSSREPTPTGDRVEEIDVGVVADGDGVAAQRSRQAREGLDQRIRRELAHRRRTIAHVHDRAGSRGIEQRRGLGQARPQIRRAARGLAGQTVEQALHACRGGVTELGVHALSSPKSQIGGHDGHAISRPEVAGQGFDDASPQLQWPALGPSGHILHNDQVEPTLTGLALAFVQHALGQDEGKIEVVVLVLLDAGIRVRIATRRPMARAVGGDALGGVTRELQPEVSARRDIALTQEHAATVHAQSGAGAHVIDARFGQVGAEGELLHVRRSIAAHGVTVETRRTGRGALNPLGVGDDDATRLTGRDGVDARAIGAGGVPLEQRRVFGRAAIDLLLVGTTRLRLLADVAIHQTSVAIHGEAREHGALRGAESVEPLDGLARGVEELLIDLRDGEVVDDAHAHIEPANGQRPARLTVSVGDAPHERADSLGSAARGSRLREPAGPVREQPLGRNLGSPVAKLQPLAFAHFPARLPRGVGDVAPHQVDLHAAVVRDHGDAGGRQPQLAPGRGQRELLALAHVDEDATRIEAHGPVGGDLDLAAGIQEQAWSGVQEEPRLRACGHDHGLTVSHSGHGRRDPVGDARLAADGPERPDADVQVLVHRARTAHSDERKDQGQTKNQPTNHAHSSAPHASDERLDASGP